MGLFDELKDMAGAAEKAVAEHPEQAKQALAKLGAFVDEQTGGDHHGQVTSALDEADDYIDSKGTRTAGQPPAAPAS